MLDSGAEASAERARGSAGILTSGTTARRFLQRYSFAFALVLAVALLIANLALESGGFGLTDQLGNFAPLGIAAMASAPAIISGGGGIDLTVSPLMTLVSAVFIVWLVPHGLAGVISVPIMLAVGIAVGALNGIIIVALRVQPVVATLSMYFVLLGVDLEIVPTPAQLTTSSWVSNLAHSVGPIPGGVITLAIPLIIWFLLGRTPFRRTLYAVGSNDATAFSSAVNVDLVRVLAYALGGLFAAIGGIALTALVQSVDGSLASTYTLLAIAAVALGGTSLWGGRGGMFGPLLGAASIYLLENLLTLAQVNPSWLQVMYGAMLVVAVVLGGATTMRTKPR